MSYKIFKHNINLKHPDEAYDSEDMIHFYNNIKKLVLYSIESNHNKNDGEPLIKEKIKIKLNDFIVYTLKKLKTSSHTLLEYMYVFMKMIEFGEFSSLRNKITTKTIIDALTLMKKYKFFIFITIDLKFSEIWLFMDEKNQMEFAKILNMLYFSTRHYFKENKYKPKKEFVIPRIEYNENIRGESDDIKLIIDETINQNKNIDDKIYKNDVIKDSHKVVDDIVETLVESGIKDASNLDGRTLYNCANSNIMERTRNKLKKHIKNTKGGANKMTDMIISMMNSYSNNSNEPDDDNNTGINIELKKTLNTLVKEISNERNKIKDKNAKRLIDNITKNFYDPKIGFYKGKKRNKLLNQFNKK
jgi:hypothetical protein